MTAKLPAHTKALVVQASSEPRKPVYHDAVLVERPLPKPQAGQVVVKIGAAGFNHKDVWIRKGQYPNIGMGAVYGGDGAGTVVASGNSSDVLLEKRVFLNPSRAAWPIGGVTAWRAVAVNAQVEAGQNVLITGIGGGVALIALQLCLAKGANVYVTSGSPDKLQKAIELGAKGGANYKDRNWPSQIRELLSKDKKNDMLDAVIDSAGGDIMNQAGKLLKQGGRVVCYGMTASPDIKFTMRQVLANQQLLGSTMGSHQDLRDATAFIEKHRIVPIVSHVVDGLESAEQGFELIKRGDQFGKVVIKLRQRDDTKL
ncbi:hypothetical protein CVT24_011799 [Panaeolus cyanescens]|uniref:Enoyl reductase (ER) domain-containing protein n=1 Tax=Panaeolus cyanescens TaxID=181874 RepID=A0A409VHD8_9AGAR|nr:hypothetical protein CVT24_011799 [Panaeolus cyanescens]